VSKYFYDIDKLVLLAYNEHIVQRVRGTVATKTENVMKVNKKMSEEYGFRIVTGFDEDLNPYGLTVDEEELINLADDMASSMADLNSQNYKMFVDTRDRFRAKIKTMVQKLQSNEERIAKVKKAIAEI
jgi:hypothetical protein